MSGLTPVISRVKGAVQVRDIVEFCTVKLREPTAERRPVVHYTRSLACITMSHLTPSGGHHENYEVQL